MIMINYYGNDVTFVFHVSIVCNSTQLQEVQAYMSIHSKGKARSPTSSRADKMLIP
jgi:hypothetical protein